MKRKNKLIALALAVSVFVCGLIMPGSAADICRVALEHILS